jgi:hypothetical protein
VKPTGDAVQAVYDVAPLGVVAGGGSNEIQLAIANNHLMTIDHPASDVQGSPPAVLGSGPGE